MGVKTLLQFRLHVATQSGNFSRSPGDRSDGGGPLAGGDKQGHTTRPLAFYHHHLLPAMPPVFSRLRQVETRGYRCPHKLCRRTLTVMTCRKGPRSGLDYVNCFNRVHPAFWHFFALGETHDNMNSIPPSPPRSAFCASPSCIKRRINRLCSRHMCKTHCLLDGGCPCHRESLPPSPPPVDPTYAWTLGSSLRNDIFPAPLHLESVARARREAELSALATLTPLPPSPTASEDADLQSNMSSGWKSTQRAMMPGIKTKRIPVGDPSYGAGASSGNKASAKQKKAATKKTTQSSQSPGLPMIPVPAASPSVLSVPSHAPPFPLSTAYQSPLYYPLPQGHQPIATFATKSIRLAADVWVGVLFLHLPINTRHERTWAGAQSDVCHGRCTLLTILRTRLNRPPLTMLAVEF
ncbi:hypothetical protein R3P38DRAFT_3344858, partial [Favolaschia claudopus]